MTYATLLVNLEAGRSNAHLLEVAGDLAERFQSGVIGMTACQPIQLVAAEGYAYGDIFDQDSQEIEKETRAAEAEFRSALQTRVKLLDWRSAVLIAWRQVNTGDLVMQVGRPVLIVAPAPAPLKLERVLIGWKDTRETRRAAADALPMLRKATHVSVVEIAAEEELEAARSRLNDVAGWLARHGVTAEYLAAASTGDDSARLHAIAEEQAADIIVAGAYGPRRAARPQACIRW